MADDPGKTPAPRPRRRRSDIDPTFKPPKVANERRRARTSPEATEPIDGAAVTEAMTPDIAAGTGVDDDAPTRVSDVPTEAAEAAEAVGSAAMFGRPDARPATDAAASVAAEAWLPMLEDRSPNPMICPFLRSAGESGIGAPIESPDPTNRCAALREAVPQSLRQQELVCLASGHVNCPRYLRGAAAVTELPPPAVRPGKALTPAILGSIILLVGAFVFSIGFVASRGGMELTAVATGSPVASESGVAAASPTAVPTDAVTPAPAPTATSTPSSSPSPSLAPSPTPSPQPTVAPNPTPEPEPTSDRYDLLTACPDAPDCWIYKVRAGDNLYSIANYFGVQLARVYAMNPWVESTGLRAGQSLRLPPPTR